MNFRAILSRQQLRYLINGLAATAIHYILLSMLVSLTGPGFVWLANATAAIGGISASFLGSHFFVFPGSSEPLISLVSKFLLVYLGAAVLHAFVLFIWTDSLSFDWRLGFILATGLQVIISYTANRRFVFR